MSTIAELRNSALLICAGMWTLTLQVAGVRV